MKKISVILPFYNEEKYIADCLKSIEKQTLKPDEVIIVDDGSTDGSAELIKKVKSQIPDVKSLTQKHQGPAAARNKGASRAKGDILVFLDADLVYDKNYIKQLVKPINRGSEIAVFTRSEYVGNLDNRWANFWDEVTFANKGRRVKKGQKSRAKAFRAIKASEFTKSGGYESFGASDDASVLEKLGKTAKAADAAKCYHKNPASLSEVFYSARWMGRDEKNKGNVAAFLIFSPLWSVVKAAVGVIKTKSSYFFPFRLAFDSGIFLGLFDNNFRGIHYK